MGPHGRRGRGPQSQEKAQHFWKTIWRLARYMGPWKWLFALAMILAIGATVFQIIAPKILGEATTVIFAGVKQGYAQIKAGQQLTHLPIAYGKITHIMIVVALVYISAAVLTFGQQFIMANISQRLVYRLRKDLKAKMERLPIAYYDTHSNGDIMSRAVNDMDNIAGTLQQSLAQLVTSSITFVGVFVMMLTISWKLTLIACVTIPLSMVVVGIVAPKSQRFFAIQQESLGLLNDQVEETYAGHAVVKTFNKEDDEITQFQAENQRYYAASWKAQFISGLIMPLMNMVKNIGYVMVAIVGGLGVANATLTLGNVQAFLQYVNQFTQPITQIANLANTIQATAVSAERIFAVLDEDEITDHPVATPVQVGAPKVAFRDVHFGYSPDKPLLQGFNMEVPAGKQVAIVGPTGAGKTTLINLLERFYDIDQGAILLDGQDTRNMARADLRQHMAMVLQNTWLFSGSIYDNIKYGREDATEEEVIAAAKAAHVDTFVRQLPDGYDTVLGEDAGNISQGQRQLLTIARAFLADPEILILDEATSSVDTRTELLIQQAMDKLLKGRTSFVVAHRLSTIQDADQIIVMNHDTIVETGTHASLLAQGGFYADLYNSQFNQAGNL